MLSSQLGFPSYIQRKYKNTNTKAFLQVVFWPVLRLIFRPRAITSHLDWPFNPFPWTRQIPWKNKTKTKITNKTNRDKTKHSIKHKKREYNEHNKNKISSLSFIHSRCRPDSPFHSFARPTGQKTLSPLTLKGHRREQRQTPQVPLWLTPGQNLSDWTFHFFHSQNSHSCNATAWGTRQEQSPKKERKKKRQTVPLSFALWPSLAKLGSLFSPRSMLLTGYRPLWHLTITRQEQNASSAVSLYSD